MLTLGEITIKVAIMGAGLSGLACAITLEQNGIYPTVFEKRGQIGDRFANGEIFLSILSNPVKDAVAYFADNFKIYLQPSSYIRHLTLYSEHRKSVVNGFLGFCNLRGDNAQSFENQLARQVKSEIIYNSQYSYEQLLREFTHVVVATGDAAYALEMRNFRRDFNVRLNGYTVKGDFDRFTIAAWLNKEFSPRGYGYLIPLSEKEANIVLWDPEYSDLPKVDPQILLTKFYGQACKDLGQDLSIINHFEVHDYTVGICHNPKIGNTFFTGNCFGAITPYLGFGQFISILTGIYAAVDICGKGDYVKLVKPLRQNYENSLVLRHAWEQFSNRGFDRMTRFFGSFIGNKIFTLKNMDTVKLASYLARPWLKGE